MKLELDSRLDKSLHYIWFSIIDLQNVQQLNDLPYSYRTIKYQIWKPISASSVNISDQVHFPGFANERMLMLQILYLGIEKLLKGLIILYNNQATKSAFTPSKSGHILLEMWHYLPNEIKVTLDGQEYKFPIKGEVEKLIDLPALLSLDYNIVRYGVDREFKVSNSFDLTVSAKNLKDFINRMQRMAETAGSCIFSIDPHLRKFLTGDNYPKIIPLDAQGLEISKLGETPCAIRFTNAPV